MAAAVRTLSGEAITVSTHHAPGLGDRPRRPSGLPEYEVQELSIPVSWSRGDVRRMLAEQAEYGRWELARSRVYAGGRRTVWLRRRIIRVRSTL